MEGEKVTDELPYTKKRLQPTMLPQEAAEVIVDIIGSDNTIADFTVLEDAPTAIANQAGFKLVYQYKTKDDLRFKSVYCGFLSGDWFCGFRCKAPARYCFEKDVGTLEQVVNRHLRLKPA